MARSLRLIASAASTIALVGAGLAVSTTTAVADPAAPGTDPCPVAYDTTTLTPGQPVTGLTTVRGTTPEEFHGTYIGTIDNGIGDGLDLPIFDMEDSRITSADGTVDAGIWAGMSGSPVYDDASGQLIGAVSYGFSSIPSRRAGVTPATYLYGLADAKYSSLSTARAKVSASRSEAAAIAKASDDPAPLGQGHVLKPSKQVSGTTSARANANAKKSPLLQKKASFKDGDFRAAGGSSGIDADYPIVPGGNIATTFSTGTITTAAIGTVTAICNGTQVFAFGHPDEFTGKSTETFNGASAVDVQEDAGFGTSYKLANVGKVKGVINQDRLQGILGTLGQAPADNTVVTTKTTGLGETKASRTDVAVPYALPYVVASQVGSDIMTVLNQYAGGDALVTWKITYTRSGLPGTQTFKRSQRTSTQDYFPDTASYEAANDIEALLGNGFEKVKISTVQIKSTLLPDYRAYKPTGAQYYYAGKWRNATSSIKTKPGTTTKVRIKLGPADAFTDVEPTTVETSITTSKKASRSGSVTFTGLANTYFEDDEFGVFYDDEYEEVLPADLDEVLELLAAQPRQDSIESELRYKTAKKSTLTSLRTVRAPGVVQGELRIPVTFVKK
jgi:hypothetical protein